MKLNHQDVAIAEIVVAELILMADAQKSSKNVYTVCEEMNAKSFAALLQPLTMDDFTWRWAVKWAREYK